METIVDLADLPQRLVDRAMAVSGKRSPKSLVKLALQNLVLEHAEPMTPAQCQASFKQSGNRIKITPKMRALGLDEPFFE